MISKSLARPVAGPAKALAGRLQVLNLMSVKSRICGAAGGRAGVSGGRKAAPYVHYPTLLPRPNMEPMRSWPNRAVQSRSLLGLLRQR
jgi:hypothetical protein